MVRREGGVIFGAWVFALIMIASLQGKTAVIKLCFTASILILFLIIFFAKNYRGFEQYSLKGRTILTVIIVFLIATLNFEVRNFYDGQLLNYEGETVNIYGTVISIQKDEPKNHQFVMKLKSEKVLVRNFDDNMDYHDMAGRKVRLSGEVSKPSAARNPRTFDYRRYLKAKGIYAIVTKNSEPIQIMKGYDNLFLHVCEKIKTDFEHNIYDYFDDEVAGIIIGMSFGEKSGIDDEIYTKFQRNGICHILAVSGLHIGVIYASLAMLSRRSKSIFANILIVSALFCFVALAGFAPSVVRAFIMIVLHICSTVVKKRYDMFTASFFTMFIMTVRNPLLVMDLGFQLSFCAILTLAILLPSAIRISKHILVSSCALQLGMAPISAYVFNYFSLSAFVLNIPVIFLAGLTIPVIMVMLVISGLSGIVHLEFFDFTFQILGIVCDFFVKLILFLNDLTFYKVKPYIQTVSPKMEVIYVYYAILFFVSSEFFRIFWQRRQFKNIAVFISIICMVAFSCGKMQDSEFDKAELIFCDVGQGDCLLVRSKDGKNILLDTGGSVRLDVGEKIVLPFLLKNGVKHLDLVVISHFDKDHVGGLSALERNIKIDRVAMYEANYVVPEMIEEKTGVNRKKYLYLAAGDECKISKNLKIYIYFPFREKLRYYKATRPNIKDENSISLVAKVTIKDISVLMTGDLDFETEEKLVNGNSRSDLKCDILKVSHHGSRYGSSEKLLSAVMPTIAVVQVGKNNYGHPSEEALERLEKSGAAIYRNDQNGAVGIEILKNRKLSVKTMF